MFLWSCSYETHVVAVKNVMKSIYTQSDAQSSAIGTAALSGAVLGQLIFGSLADQLGRKTIFVVTLSCVVIGSIGSSLCFDTQLVGIYAQLTFWQFILGFGIGGEYPLSATITSENSDTKNRGKNVSSRPLPVLLTLNGNRSLLFLRCKEWATFYLHSLCSFCLLQISS